MLGFLLPVNVYSAQHTPIHTDTLQQHTHDNNNSNKKRYTQVNSVYIYIMESIQYKIDPSQNVLSLPMNKEVHSKHSSFS